MSAVSVSLCFVTLLIKSCFAEATKASKSTQTPPTSRMIHWDKLEVVDYLRSGALLVAFFAVLLSDKRGKTGNVRGRKNMFVSAEVVAFFVTGLACYFFPTSFLEYIMKAALGPAHLFFIQFIGAMMIMHAVTTARLQSSIEKDATVRTSWLISRLCCGGALLWFVIIKHQSNYFFLDQNLTFHVLAIALWFAGTVYQLFTAESLGSAGGYRGNNSNMNFYLGLWVIIELSLNLSGFATANESLAMVMTVKPDPVMVYLMQGVVLHSTMNCLETFAAMFYSNDEDKRQIFFGHIVGVVLSLPLVVLYQCKHALHTQNGFISVIVLLVLYLAINIRGYRMK